MNTVFPFDVSHSHLLLGKFRLLFRHTAHGQLSLWRISLFLLFFAPLRFGAADLLLVIRASRIHFLWNAENSESSMAYLS